jgi:hypothetical protein
MKRFGRLMLLLSATLLIQCENFKGYITIGNVDCSDAVLTTDIYTVDSVTLSRGDYMPDVDEFGWAQITMFYYVSNGCPGDSVKAGFTCHLVPGSPKEIFIAQSVKNNQDDAIGIAKIVSVNQTSQYEINGTGSYMAPDRSTEEEFTAIVSFFFESSGYPPDDLVFFQKYFKDLTIRFTYSKLQ